MSRLVQELSSESFKSAHPILQSAYAHYSFVCIHPFADGNGRVARALASAYLYRNPGVPLIVYADQKVQYLDTLESADAGNPEPFIRFVASRVIDAVEMVRLELRRAASRRQRARVLADMTSALESDVGMSHLEVDALAARLFDTILTEFSKQIAELEVPTGIGLQPQMISSSHSRLEGYRPVHSSLRHLVISAVSREPASVKITAGYDILVATAQTIGPKFVVLSRQGARLQLELEELRPAFSAVAEWKIAVYVETEITDILTDLSIKVNAALRQKGYR